ncbi:NUDIX hydrolase [Pararhizobium antarcticum]|uniref:NUDIX hydrolase n=1 Tax=Pararhizobium antarcticum TaxID=1798805 RepID=UPI0008FF81D4|nr:NUDIX hydrolase [Pararhizobium antarcticum]
MNYLSKLVSKTLDLMNGRAVDQCGAICYRTDRDGTLLVLLISSRGTGRWVIPKGTVESGEKSHKAAEREAREEAGVKGKAEKHPCGYFTYVKDDTKPPFIVSVHLLRVESLSQDFPEKGQREHLWITPQEASKLVTEPELQGLFRHANKRP